MAGNRYGRPPLGEGAGVLWTNWTACGPHSQIGTTSTTRSAAAAWRTSTARTTGSTTATSQSKCSGRSWPRPSAPSGSCARSTSRPASSTPHPPAVRLRGRRRLSLLRHALRRRRDPPRPHPEGEAAPAGRRAPDRPGGRRRAELRPRAGRPPPRHQAGQHPAEPVTHALVADFGIAKAISSGGRGALTGTGLAIGTPEYMSPEQGSGEQDRGPALRHLCARLRALRDARGPAAVHRADGAGGARAPPPGGAAPAAGGPARAAAGDRAGRGDRARQDPGGSVRHRGGVRGGTGGDHALAAAIPVPMPSPGADAGSPPRRPWRHSPGRSLVGPGRPPSGRRPQQGDGLSSGGACAARLAGRSRRGSGHHDRQRARAYRAPQVDRRLDLARAPASGPTSARSPRGCPRDVPGPGRAVLHRRLARARRDSATIILRLHDNGRLARGPGERVGRRDRGVSGAARAARRHRRCCPRCWSRGAGPMPPR